MYDIIIIGAGPAGLQAAMALSLVRRRHLIISIPNSYRNLPASEMHTFLTRDGTPPLQFARLTREQWIEWNGDGFAKFVDGKVVSTENLGKGFEVKVEDGTKYSGRKLINATGATDVFLPIEGTDILSPLADLGFAELWGTDIVHWRLRTQGSIMRGNRV